VDSGSQGETQQFVPERTDRALLEELGTAIVHKSLNIAGFSQQSPHESLLLKGN